MSAHQLLSRSVRRRRSAKSTIRHQKRLRNTFRALQVEPLESRRLLAVVLTMPPNAISSAASLFDEGLQLIPQDIRDKISDLIPDKAEDVLEQIVDRADAGVLYQAFPGEVNTVSLDSDMANLLLLFNENKNVSLIRGGLAGALPPLVIDEVLKALIPDFSMGINFGGAGGPVVVEVGAKAKGDITIKAEQIRGLLKQTIDLSSARAVIFNQHALLDFIPGLDNVVDVMGNFLDFDVTDVLNFDFSLGGLIDPIIDMELPFGLPDLTIPPDIEINIGEFLNDVGIPTSFRDLADVLPGPVNSVFDIAMGALDFFSGDTVADRVFISTLDGADTISFPNLTGVPVTVYAGTGGDTITIGGGESFVDSLVDVFDILNLGLLYDDKPIELFGESGGDTFILTNRFNNRDLTIDGGDGNDQLIVKATSMADIIEVEADADGKLKEIRFFVPDPNDGNPTDEVQRVTLPSGVDFGTFTLTFTSATAQSDTTGPIPYNADGSVVQNALENLSNIDSGDVTVTGPAGGPYVITFSGALAEGNQPALTGDGSDLRRVGASVDVQELQDGNPQVGINQIQRIDLPPNPISTDPNEGAYVSGGTFTLTFEGSTTEAIAFNASRARVQEALEALPTLDSGDVVVSGSLGGPWFVEFIGNRELTNPAEMDADGSELTGGVEATVTEATVGEALVQTVTLPNPLPGQSLGGTFKLSIGGSSTAPLAANASSLEVENALATLPGVGVDNVDVTGPFGGPWDVALSGIAAETGGVTGDASGLSGGVSFSRSEHNGSGQNQIQRISTGGATAGTFRLTFDNGTFARTTGDLPLDATAGEIETALENLTSVGTGNVIVTGSVGGPWDVEFIADLAASHQLLLQMDGSNLNSGSVIFSSNIAETVTGGAGVNEQQVVEILPQGAAIGGTFILNLTPITTAPIPFDADGAVVQAALNAQVASDSFSVTGPSKGPYTIEFVGLLKKADWNLFSADISGLSGNVAVVQATIPGTNEVQTLTPSHPLTGGRFTLIFDGATTETIPFNAHTAQIQAALEGLPGIDPDEISVSGISGGPWTVEFVGAKAATNQPSITFDTSDLIGGFSVPDIDVVIVSPAINEVQTIALDPIIAPEGGQFTLRFVGNEKTTPLDVDATLLDIDTALEALSSIGVGNVEVTGTPGDWAVSFVGDLAANDVARLWVDTSDLKRGEPIEVEITQEASLTNEIQRVQLPLQVSDGSFTLDFQSLVVEETIKGGDGPDERQTIKLPAGATGGEFRLTFGNNQTADIPFDATAADVQLALQGLPSIGGAINVHVTGLTGGPWMVDFTGVLGDTDVPLIQTDGSDLDGLFETVAIPYNASANEVRAALQSLASLGGASADNVQVTTPEIEIEQTIRGGIGVNEVQSISLPDNVNGGTFTLTFQGHTTAPINYNAPATGFGSVKAALDSLSSAIPGFNVVVVGNDGGPWSVAFTGMSSTDVEMMTADSSNLNIVGGPWTIEFVDDDFSPHDFGGRTLELMLLDGSNLVTTGRGDPAIETFTSFTIDGGTPIGADAVRFEGTAGDDNFVYTPDAFSIEAGAVQLGAVTLQFVGVNHVSFEGSEGLDSLTVNEPTAGSNDSIRFFPETGNNGSYQFTSQSGGPETTMVYALVAFGSVETRNFNSGAGADTLFISTDLLPGVNTSLMVDGGSGVATVAFGDQLTTFTHNSFQEDTLILDITATRDGHTIDVTPGIGLGISLSVGAGYDTLTFHAMGTA